MKIPKSITILLILAIFLNIARILLFKTNSSLYMFWNIFLAFIPFFISYILLLRTDRGNIIKPFFIIGFILWILFLPNAPYVMTDFIHLGRTRFAPEMFDIFFFFSSALVSLLVGLYSIYHMEKILLLKFSKRAVNIAIPIIILFTSFGMYLGRFLRFNSWDFFVSHKFLLTSIWKVFVQPVSVTNVHSYILLFFLFIYVSYLAFRSAISKQKN